MQLFTILAPLLLSASSLALAHYDGYNHLDARGYDELASLHTRDLYARDAYPDAYPDALAEAYHAGYLAARSADPEAARLERRMMKFECVACGKILMSNTTPHICPNQACPGHKDRDPNTIRYVSTVRG